MNTQRRLRYNIDAFQRTTPLKLSLFLLELQVEGWFKFYTNMVSYGAQSPFFPAARANEATFLLEKNLLVSDFP